MKIHKNHAGLVARKRMLKYLVLNGVRINSKHYPNIKEYCKLIGVEVPPTKKKSKTFLIKEYQRELSPIFEGVKLPVCHRKNGLKKTQKNGKQKGSSMRTILIQVNGLPLKTKLKKNVVINVRNAEKRMLF